MTKNYSINITNKITIIRFFNPPSIDDIRNSFDDIEDTNLRLWDISNGVLNFTHEEIIKLAKYGKSKLPLGSKAAIVAPESHAFALSRIYEAYGEHEQSETRVFRTEQKALEWLKSQSPINF